MYGIQWFKVDRNIFNNRKIQLLLKKRDGDLYFRVWIQLLSIAVECGNDGRFRYRRKTDYLRRLCEDHGKNFGQDTQNNGRIP